MAPSAGKPRGGQLPALQSRRGDNFKKKTSSRELAEAEAASVSAPAAGGGGASVGAQKGIGFAGAGILTTFASRSAGAGPSGEP